MEQNLKQSQKRKRNMKLYSLYRMISMDIVFFYAIEFLFLTQVKNISASQYVLLYSFYALFMVLLQIPANILIDRIGTRRATIIANFFNSVSMLITIFAQNFEVLIVMEFIGAMGFSIKDVSDSTLLTHSIPDCRKKGEIYSKIEGKGQRNYYWFNAITSVIAGLLYAVNPYIPMVLALLFCIFSTIVSLGFQEIGIHKINKEPIIDYFIDLKDTFKFIVKSNRLRSLILYSGIIWGFFCLISTYRTSILKDIGISAQWIAIATAITEIAIGIGARIQLHFHKKFRNKSLSVILIITSIAIMGMGLAGISTLTPTNILIIIIILNVILDIGKGVNNVLSSRYLGNFTDNKILSKIYSANAISKNLFRMFVGFLGSYLLNITNTANATIIIGLIFVIVTIYLMEYMKKRLGLKPEEYKFDDINFK